MLVAAEVADEVLHEAAFVGARRELAADPPARRSRRHARGAPPRRPGCDLFQFAESAGPRSAAAAEQLAAPGDGPAVVYEFSRAAAKKLQNRAVATPYIPALQLKEQFMILTLVFERATAHGPSQ